MTTIQFIGLFIVGGGMGVMWTTFMSEKARAHPVTIFIVGGALTVGGYLAGRAAGV
jgi:hypothetical protein